MAGNAFDRDLITMAEPSKMPLHIVADSREQSPFRFEGYPVTVAITALEAGDYSLAGIERKVAVERKALADLVQCLGADRERFQRELSRLRGYDFAAVVVEAPAVDLRAGRYRGHLNSESAWQSIISFSQRFRIPFFFCKDRADAERVTFDLLRHFARDRWKELSALQDAEKIGAESTLARTRVRIGIKNEAEYEKNAKSI